MAKDNGNNTVTVERGDTLSAIAKQFLGSASKYQELASINGISNPNRIYVGQIIKLTSTAGGGSGSGGSGSGSGSGGGSGSSSTSTTNSNAVNITAFGLQSDSNNTLFITWTWSKDNTESYLVEWTYDTGNNVWFVGNSSTNSVDKENPNASLQSTYGIPSNAKSVRVRIKPISKTYTKNDKETNYWTANWSTYKIYYITSIPPSAPSVPSVKIDKYKLTAELANIAEDAAEIEFQVVKDDTSVFKTGKCTVTTRSATYACNVNAGSKYKVRCRSIRGTKYSEWSDYSENVNTIPATPDGITTIKATSETAVYLEWEAVPTAETYDIEYTTDIKYFDTSDETTTKTGIESTSYEITGIETGEEYFFRIRAVNDSGESGWSGLASLAIGEKPAAPTTWSSTTTCITGEELTLYWVHNSADGSSQTYAELELIVNGFKETYTVKNSEDEEEKDKTSSYKIDTSPYVEGTTIQWRVRTAGVTKEYGDWSIQRTVDIYAPPTLELSMTDATGTAIETLTSFPFYIYGLPGPNTQAPIGYHLSVKSNEIYETTDNVGNDKIVNIGDELYSKHFDITDSLLVEFTPANIDLENNIKYTVSCTVSMDSGLTVESTLEFTVAWTDVLYSPNAEIGYDEETYVTHIHPYCTNTETQCLKVEYIFENETYEKTTELLDLYTITDIFAETGEKVFVGIDSRGLELYYAAVYIDENENPIDPIYYKAIYSEDAYRLTDTVIDISTIRDVHTTTGEIVLMGFNEAGDEIRYCTAEKSGLVEGVTLSVYRREFDGTFTELATGLSNTSNTFITDPHPALDYARYRVVAITDATGVVSYYDIPAYPIGEIAVIIQWDEEWSSFDTTENDELAKPTWSGSLLRLPYNIDVSDSNSLDVTLVEYAGRRNPVSYYGTQIGQKSSWNVEIPKDDKETLYALRRLAIWMGDVYVREPSGTGYWANISVSFSQKHCDVKIPVSFSITRVEGGV